LEHAVLKEIREPAPTTSPAMPMPGSDAAAPATVAPATAFPETSVDDTAAAEMSNESVSPAGVVGTQAPASVTIPEGANDGSAIDGSAIGGSLRQEIETKTTATPGEGERAARSATVPATAGAAEAVSAFPAAAPPAEDAASATAPAMQDEAAPTDAARPMAPPIESGKRERRDATMAAPAAAPAPSAGSAPVTSPGGDAVMSVPNSIDTDTGRPGPASESQAEGEVAAARAKSAAENAPPAESEQQKALRAIRDLIAAGRFSDAQLALARFVRTYPDYRVPADILQALKPAD
jgi:2-oxoglutarate dehydrogenase E2 component (dihydrolipoamide succinyltransferase)